MVIIDIEELVKKGEKSLKNGDYEKALEHYRRATRIEPIHPDWSLKAWCGMGNALGRIKENEEALEAYEKALNIRPEYAEAWYEKGNILRNLKWYEEALEAYEKAAILEPYPEAHIEKGDVLIELKKHKEALEAYEEAIKILEESEAHEEAIKILEESEAYKETSKIKLMYAEVWYKKGSVLGYLKNNVNARKAYEEAKKLYEEINRENRNDVKVLDGSLKALDGKIELYKELKKKEKELKKFETYANRKLECARIWYKTGDIFFLLGRYEDELEADEEAIKIYKELVADKQSKEIERWYAEAWNGKGVALGNLGKYKEALEAYEKAIELDPEFALPWHNKGIIFLFHLEKYEEALKAYENAIRIFKKLEDSEEYTKIKPIYASTCYYKGIALAHLKKDEKAIEAYGKAIELDPEYAYAWNDMGTALKNLWKHEKAIKAYEKAIGLKPKYALPYAYLGELYLAHGDLETASCCISKACDLDKRNALSLLLRGRIEIEKEKYDRALKFFDKAAHFSFGSPLPLLWTAYAKYLKVESSSELRDKKYDGEIFAIIRELERAYDLSKEYPEDNLRSCILYFLGYFYYRSGDIFAAKERLEDCVKLESKMRKLKEFIKSESSMKKLKELFRPKSSVKPRTCELLNHIWTYKIKPSWWSWWLSSPLNRWTKRIVFFFLLIPIFSLLLYLVIPDSMLLIKGDLFVYATFISGSISFIEKNLSAYALLVSLSLFLLLSPFITKIKVKEFEAELSSPPVLEPFISPSMIEEKLQR